MKTFPRWTWWGLCVGLVLFAACAAQHTSPRTDRMLDDKVIAERVEVALREASASDFSDVQVHTTNAVVTLHGSVHSRQAKEKAAEAAKGVQNVRRVDNEIQVHQ